MKAIKETNVKTLVHVSILIAIEVILSRFLSINTPFVRISLGFIPVAICAMLYGPVWTVAAAVIGDIIGAIVVPTGSIHLGITLSTALTGLVFGLFLYKKESGWLNIALPVSINCIGISFFLTSFWLADLFGNSYAEMLAIRIWQCLILIPVQFVVLSLLRPPVMKYARKQLA